jgi:hypothetical protein
MGCAWHVEWAGAVQPAHWKVALPVTNDLNRSRLSISRVIIKWITISYVKTKRRGYKYRSSEET